MPSESGPAQQAGRLTVTAAPIVEFHFAIFLITKYLAAPDKPVPVWVPELTAAHPAVVERFASFWRSCGLEELPRGAGPYREHGELLVVAWHANLLLSDDVSAFLTGLPRYLAEVFAIPPMESEPADVADLIGQRLMWLRNNPAGRAEYCDTVTELWPIIEPLWLAARGKTERTVKDLAARARTETDPRVLAPGNKYVHKDEFRDQVNAARARGEMVILPLGLGGDGQLFWSLPGILLVAVGLETGEREEQRRERSERAAGRFKVLSDPTRLSILLELLRPSCDASTVTELASRFGLSQPTVSVHIKLLREAGLVQADRDGNQVHYKAEGDVLRRYVEEATEDVIGAVAPGADTLQPASNT